MHVSRVDGNKGANAELFFWVPHDGGQISSESSSASADKDGDGNGDGRAWRRAGSACPKPEADWGRLRTSLRNKLLLDLARAPRSSLVI